MEATLSLDLSKLDKAFAGMSRRGRNLAPAFRGLAPDLKKDQQKHWRARQAPDGKWAPLAPSTVKKRSSRARGRKVSTLPLGKLRTGIGVQWNRRSLWAESKSPWSGVHQHGGTAGRGSRIPGRMFLWLSSGMIDKTKTALLAYIVRRKR